MIITIYKPMKKYSFRKKFYFLFIWLFFASLSFSFLPTKPLFAEESLFKFEYKNPLSVNSITEWLKGILAAFYGIIAWFAVIMIVIGGIVYITSSGRSAQMELGKKIIRYALIGFTIVVAAPTLLKEIYNLAIQSGGGTSDVTTGTTVAGILTNIMNFILATVGILAIITFVVAGIMLVMSGGNSTHAKKAKDAIFFSIIGISIAGAGLIIIQQILALLQ